PHRWRIQRDGYTGRRRQNGAPSPCPLPPGSSRPGRSPPQGSWECTSGQRSPASAGRYSRGGTAGWCCPRSGRPSGPQRSPARSGKSRRRDPGGRADRGRCGRHASP
ncbi:Hydroxymethylpyrimidine transporter CytX, partial [Dysosmobacter welbionis]